MLLYTFVFISKKIWLKRKCLENLTRSSLILFLLYLKGIHTEYIAYTYIVYIINYRSVFFFRNTFKIYTLLQYWSTDDISIIFILLFHVNTVFEISTPINISYTLKYRCSSRPYSEYHAYAERVITWLYGVVIRFYCRCNVIRFFFSCFFFF